MSIESVTTFIIIVSLIGIVLEFYAFNRLNSLYEQMTKDLKRLSELENHHFGSQFTYQLWDEKKNALEKENKAMRIALEKATLDAADLQDKYVGLEKTLRDFKLQLREEELKRLDKVLTKKVKKAPQD